MTSRLMILSLAVAALSNLASQAQADTVQLVNGDAIRGKVVLLDDKQLVFRSDSFGELKLARAKVELIVLGDRPLPSAPRTAAAPSLPAGTAGSSVVGQVAPLLQTPAAQQQLGPMVERLLGAGGLGDLQKNVDTARQGLQDLKKDFGQGPESQVLDSYINMFNLLSPPASNAQTPRNVPHPKAPPVSSKGPETKR
jgi:hypothetical protein